MPEEQVLLLSANEKRRRDFSAGRTCARNSIKKMGLQPCPVLADTNRMPLWPPGIRGSITHCPEYCAAAVAEQSLYTSIGIDAERHREMDDRLLNYISLPEEQHHLATLPQDLNWRLLLFSAKESVYKFFYPFQLRRLRFQDVLISFEPDAGSFQAQLVPQSEDNDKQILRYHGKFLVTGDLYLTAVWQMAK